MGPVRFAADRLSENDAAVNSPIHIVGPQLSKDEEGFIELHSTVVDWPGIWDSFGRIIAYSSITQHVVRDEVRIVVRRPLAEIEADIRSTLSVRGALLDVSIEKDALSFAFAPAKPLVRSVPAGLANAGNRAADGSQVPIVERTVRRRRKRRVRHRTKTRGWAVVAKITNSRGQSCAIYEPMFSALSKETLPKRQAYGIVREILESNGNDPSPATIEYYVENTLEYIQRSRDGAKPAM